MKKLNYILLLLVVFAIFVTVSCAGDKLDDNTAPRVADIRFNVNDTIQYQENGVKKIITLNDSLTGSLETDVLVIGKRIRFRGYFVDDKGLSTAYFHIWGDTLEINDVDGSYNMKRLMPIYMFGQTELQINSLGTILADPLPIIIKSKGSLKDLIVRDSKKDHYYFSVRCSDMAGNEDLTSYPKHAITLFTRESVIEEAKKNPQAFKIQ